MSESQYAERVAVQTNEPVKELVELSENAPAISPDEAGKEKKANESEVVSVSVDEERLDVVAPNSPESTTSGIAPKKEKRQSVLAKLLAFVKEKSPKKGEEGSSQITKLDEDQVLASGEDVAMTVAVDDEALAQEAVAVANSAPEDTGKSPKLVEEAEAKTEAKTEAQTEATSPAPKEKMGRRLSTRLGSFFGKKDAKHVEAMEVNALEIPVEATSEVTEHEPTIEAEEAAKSESSADSESAEPAAEVKTDTAMDEPAEAITLPAEPVQLTEDAAKAVATTA